MASWLQQNSATLCSQQSQCTFKRIAWSQNKAFHVEDSDGSQDVDELDNEQFKVEGQDEFFENVFQTHWVEARLLCLNMLPPLEIYNKSCETDAIMTWGSESSFVLYA